MARALKYIITRDDLRVIGKYAKTSVLGTKSWAGRGNYLEQQITALTGNYVLCMWHFGSAAPFVEMREEQDETPGKGDEGHDLPGIFIDIKTSLIRSSKGLWDHYLWVRSNELHEGNTYALALVDAKDIEEIRHSKSLGVYLMGWCEWRDLALDGEGRYARIARELYPFPPLPRSPLP